MSLSSKNRRIEHWDDIGNNSDQNYLTHSLFRYFGKLPPVLTGRILEEFVSVKPHKNPLVLDLMCGSGTTLVECQRLGFQGIGVDANDIAVLASRVKTSPLPIDSTRSAIDEFRQLFGKQLTEHPDLFRNGKVVSSRTSHREMEDSVQFIPKSPNIERWFHSKTIQDLATCRGWIETYRRRKRVFDFLLLSWLGIVRQCSRASSRTGRIFLDKQKKDQPVFDLLLKRLETNIRSLEAIPKAHFSILPLLFIGDARGIDLKLEARVDFTFFHPPYFALYKYSSDVLRFELEWGHFERKRISQLEIQDGFKTSDASLSQEYVVDIVEVVKNGFRHTKESGNVCIVIGDSTLSEKKLGIVERVLEECRKIGYSCRRLIERPVNYSQSRYHKSANPNIRTLNDFIAVFERG